MAYQTGVTSSLADLLTTMLTFATSNGFTLGPQWTFPDNNYQAKSLFKDGAWFVFAIPINAGVPGLFMNTCSSSPTTIGDLVNQAGAHSVNQRVRNLQGPHVGYHFFCDGNSLHVCVEIVTNVFVHFSFGVMLKNGSWTGGHYVTGLDSQVSGSSLADPFSTYNVLPFDTASLGSENPNFATSMGHVRVPNNGPTNAISRSNTGPLRATVWATVWASNVGRDLITYTPNNINGRAVLTPINFAQASLGASGPYYQLGTVGNARGVNIKNLNPKETVNTDWMVFPLSQKNGPGTVYLNSANLGMAYLK